MIHFPPCFRFPPIFEKISDSVENFPNFTFSRKISRFSSAKISHDLFLVIDHKFRISPLFSLFHYISPLFLENYYFLPLLYFEKFSPCFRKIHLLFTYFMCISFPPYFDHDAFMHHPMQALDAPVGGSWFELNCPINTPMVGLLANTLPVLLRAFLLSLSCLVHSSCLPFHQMLLLFINAFLSS